METQISTIIVQNNEMTAEIEEYLAAIKTLRGENDHWRAGIEMDERRPVQLLHKRYVELREQYQAFLATKMTEVPPIEMTVKVYEPEEDTYAEPSHWNDGHLKEEEPIEAIPAPEKRPLRKRPQVEVKDIHSADDSWMKKMLGEPVQAESKTELQEEMQLTSRLAHHNN